MTSTTRRMSEQELRERLLRDEEVRRVIALRAYEIYVNRGMEQGRDAEDWFQAETEILAFLIEEESRLAPRQSPRSGPSPAVRPSEMPNLDSARPAPPRKSREDAPGAKTRKAAGTKRSSSGKQPAEEPTKGRIAPGRKPRSKQKE